MIQVILILLLSVVSWAETTAKYPCYANEFVSDVNNPDYKLIQDEKVLHDLFRIYKFANTESYGMCIVRHWLFCNPLVKITETRAIISDNISVTSLSMFSPFTSKPTNYIKYTRMGRQYIPLEVGDLNFDGITNYIDYAIWSKSDSNCLKCEEMSLTDIANIFGSMF